MWGRERFGDTSKLQLLSRDVIDKHPHNAQKNLFGECFCLNNCLMNQFRTRDVLARNNNLHCARAVSDTYLAELFLHKQCAAFMIEPI